MVEGATAPGIQAVKDHGRDLSTRFQRAEGESTIDNGVPAAWERNGDEIPDPLPPKFLLRFVRTARDPASDIKEPSLGGSGREE